MNQSPEQLFHTLQSPTLTFEERSAMRHMISVFSDTSSYPSSHWHRLALSFAGLLLVVGTGVSLLAQGTLPGDTLYSVKTGVIDQINSLVTIGEDAKINLELQQIDRALVDENAAAQRDLTI